MDEDLEGMTRDELVREIGKLRAAIRDHRGCSGHDLCWFHPELWALLPEHKREPITVPAWPDFLRGCVRYRQSLDEQLPDAPRESLPFETKSDTTKRTDGSVREG